MAFWQRWGGSVKKIWTQIKHYLKRDKGSYISFGVIVLFTAFLLNLALVICFQVDSAYDEKFEALHTANINFCIPKSQDTEELADELMALQSVAELDTREAVFMEAVVKEFRDTDFSMNTVFYNIAHERRLNRVEVKEQAGNVGDDGIYIPLYVASFGQFSTGEEIVYEAGGNSYSFVVTGVLEEMQYGNYGKGLMGAYLTEAAYERLSLAEGDRLVTEYSLTTDEGVDVEQLKREITELLSDRGVNVVSMCDSVSTKETRTMVCNLLIIILAAFSLVVLLVSVVLCKFRVSNAIDEEMVNMGVLKALGYTGNMIVATMVIPYAIVTVAAAVAGALCSYMALPVVSDVLALQSGFSFQLTFDGKSLICVVFILALAVVMFAYGVARRIRNIQPINAMSGRTGGKSGTKQKLLLFFVSFVLAILVAFAGTLFYNVIVKPWNFMSTLSEETPDVIICQVEEAQTTLKDVLKNDIRVEEVLEYSVVTADIDENPVSTFVCEDFDRVSNDLCYKGENPKAENEIALGSAFEDSYRLGDYVEVKSGDRLCQYKVTGFVQSVNNQGNVCELTVEGYESLCQVEYASSLYVYLRDGEDSQEFMDEYSSRYKDEIASTVNSEKVAETSQGMYSGITAVIIAAIFVLTMLIVLFILYIVIRTLLVQRKQELGIYKAIGYSNRQLMVGLAGEFLPVSVIAILSSSILGLWYMPHINEFIFQSVGAMKNNMEISIVFLMIFALVQISMNFVISVILSMPIKNISVYSLLKE